MPYMIPSQYAAGTSIGDTLANLGNSLFGKDALTAEVYRQKATGLRRENNAYQVLQDAERAGGYDPNNGDTRAAIVGLDKPSNFFEAQRGIAATQFGARDPRATNAFVGAGGNYGSTAEGFDRGEGTKMSIARLNADKAMQIETMKEGAQPVNVLVNGKPVVMSRADAIKQGATPVLSAADAQGMLRQNNFDTGFANLNAPQLAAAGAEPKQDHATNYYVPGTSVVGRTMDGKTDAATNQPLPANAQLVSPANPTSIGALNPQAPDQKITGLLKQKIISANELSQLADRADKLVAADPTIVGPPGVAQKLGQNVVAAAVDVANYLGKGKDLQTSLNNVRQEAQTKLGASAPQLLPELFKPGISELEAIHGILVYKAAETLFGQSDRGLSDKDVRNARQVVGDPQSLFESSQSFRTKMQLLKQQADAQSRTARQMLEGNDITQRPVMPASPAPSAVTAPAAQPRRVIDIYGNPVQ
jgi:hypothetical protein